MHKLKSFNQHIEVLQNKRLLLGISGGLDSMVLCHLLIKSKIYFELAHVNYNLRGEDSILDERFVQSFANQHNLEFHCKRLDNDQWHKGLNLQNEARNIRYSFFNAICKSKNLDLIATAHHLNDSIETMLLNLFRGSDLKGLAGIPFVNQNTCKPLIKVTRSELALYAFKHHIEYRTDHSNYSEKYNRNFLRNKIIPEIKTRFSSFEKSVETSIKNTQLANNFLSNYFQKERSDKLIYKNEFIYLNKKHINDQQEKEFYLFKMLKPFHLSRSQIDNIIQSLDEKGKRFLTTSHEICISHEYLIIQKLNEGSNDLQKLENTDSRFIIHGRKYNFEITKFNYRHLQLVDLEKIKWPLYSRSWVNGDKIKTTGMVGKKKVKKIFSDHKLSLFEKTQVPIIVDADNEIIWVVGFQIAEKVKPDNSTKQFVFIP